MDAVSDTRTCLVCNEPVAPQLRGYLDSLRACTEHLSRWHASPERMAAVLERMNGRGTSISEAFSAWAQREHHLAQ